MNADKRKSNTSWPFPTGDQLRRRSDTQSSQLNPSEFRPDPVEQELVAEQLKRDREASRAVDHNRRPAI